MKRVYGKSHDRGDDDLQIRIQSITELKRYQKIWKTFLNLSNNHYEFGRNCLRLKCQDYYVDNWKFQFTEGSRNIATKSSIKKKTVLQQKASEFEKAIHAKQLQQFMSTATNTPLLPLNWKQRNWNIGGQY